MLKFPPGNFFADSSMDLADARLPVDFQIPQDQFPKPMPLNASKGRVAFEIQRSQDRRLDKVFRGLGLPAHVHNTQIFESSDPVFQIIGPGQLQRLF